jgi:hypothetical protein
VGKLRTIHRNNDTQLNFQLKRLHLYNLVLDLTEGKVRSIVLFEYWLRSLRTGAPVKGSRLAPADAALDCDRCRGWLRFPGTR